MARAADRRDRAGAQAGPFHDRRVELELPGAVQVGAAPGVVRGIVLEPANDHLHDVERRSTLAQGGDTLLERAEQPSTVGHDLAVGDVPGPAVDRQRERHRSPRGGSVWESNPPRTASRPTRGFEDREGHRAPCASIERARAFRARAAG
jgi:hypothetical protein